MYPWLKAFHVIAMVTWFAGLFYLPRLFVYHAMALDQPSIDRFKVMERKLYRGITTPSAVLTVALGITLTWHQGIDWFLATQWMHAKLGLVTILIGYHAYLGHLVKVFAADSNLRSHVYYRWLNEFPVLILISVVLLAEIKPG